MMRPLKIAHLIMEFNLGGIESMLLDIMRIQYEAGHKLTLFILHDIYSQTLINVAKQYAEVVFLHGNSGIAVPLAIFKLNIKLRIWAPDAVHCHNPKFVKALFYPKDMIFSSVHGISQNHDSFCSALSKINRIFAISDAVRDDLYSRYHYPNIVTIANGIDLSGIERRGIFGHIDSLRIVQVSRLEHQKKGQDILIKAVSRLAADGFCNDHGIRIDFIGEGESEEYLRQLTDELGCRKYISFLGKLPREQVYKCLKNYDVIIQPSRYEGFGLTIVEGMAAGLIPVVSDRGGPREVVGDDGKAGLLFKCDDPADCAAVLKKIFDLSPQQLNEFQSNAIERSKKYSIENTCLKFERFYRHQDASC